MKLFRKLIATLTLGIAAISLSGCFSVTVYANADKYVAGSQYYDGELMTLDISWTSGSVTLIQDENAGQITIEEENNLEESKKVHSYFHDGILSIKYCKSGIRVGNIKSTDKKLFITFPKLTTLNLAITSGSFICEKLDAEKMNLKMTSGSIDLGEINSDDFRLKITSGEVNIASLTSKTANFDSTSGKITIDNLKVEEGKFHSTSGSINVKVEMANKLEFDLTSGNIDLTIPENGATLRLHKTSGKFNSTREHTTENNTYVYGDGSCDIKIDITSGNVTIR